jgi:hypothetical protein
MPFHLAFFNRTCHKALSLALLVICFTLPLAHAAPPSPESESLEAILKNLKQLDRMKDTPRFESPVDPVRRPQEFYSSKIRYETYLKKASPLYKQLLLVQKRMDKPPKEGYRLQPMAALNFQSLMLFETLLPQLSEEELRFQSFKLMSQAVLKLDEAVQAWRQQNSMSPPYRSERSALEDDNYVLDLKLQSAQEALAELKRFNEMHDILVQGYKQAER